MILLSNLVKMILLTWQQTRKMKSVIAVHNTFSLKWICKVKRGDCLEKLEIHYQPIPFWPHANVHVRLVINQTLLHSYDPKIREKHNNSTFNWTATDIGCPQKPFTLKLTFLSGFETSGKTEMNGRNTSRNFTVHEKERDRYFYPKTRRYSLYNATTTIDNV